MDEVREKLKPFASSLDYKEKYLTAEDLAGRTPHSSPPQICSHTVSTLIPRQMIRLHVLALHY
jgi:hypothetical protein